MSHYKGAIREYTFIGIGPIFEEIAASPRFAAFFGGVALSKIFVVIRDGVFYHFQQEEEVSLIMKSFLRRIIAERVDVDLLYREYDATVSRFESFYERSPDNFSLETLPELYAFYRECIGIAYIASYAADFLDEVVPDVDEKSRLLDWIIRLRTRGEDIYKHGELIFVPQYLAWMSKEIPGEYAPEQLSYLTHREWLAYCHDPKEAVLPEKSVLDNRKQLLYACFGPTSTVYAVGDEAKRYIEEYQLFPDVTEEVDSVQEFPGTTAFAGVVTGRVRRIMKLSDTKQFQVGEIIVSPMTDPNYIQVMKQASAFVTDEGGTLCHAAIVAREMKKPCIIGTKIATQVLKDGDLVEVDADQGVVRILEKVK